MRPNVFEYTDHRKVIKDLMVWMASVDRKHSLRWFAKKAEFAAPSMLSMALAGKRSFTRERITAVCNALKVTQPEAEYIRLIFEKSNATDEGELDRINDEICKKFRGGLFRDPREEEWAVFSKWYLPVVRELVGLSDFRADPFWISGKVGIRPEEAQEALTLLLRIGLLGTSPGGDKFVRCEPSIQPKSPPPPGRMDQFNREMSSHGLIAIDLPRDRRYFNSLTVSCSRYTFERIKDVLSRLIAEVDMIAEDDAVREEIAQLNIQFFSMTDVAALKRRREAGEGTPSKPVEKGINNV